MLGDLTPLAKIKNLEHLSLRDVRWGSPSHGRRMLQSMIRNSLDTLESLSIETGRLIAEDHLLVDWDEKVSFVNCKSEATFWEATFPRLKVTVLTSYMVDAFAVQALQHAIDFTKLADLKIGDFHDDGLLFQSLAALAGSSSFQSTVLNLRHLSISMALSYGNYGLGVTPEQVMSRCKLFIVSYLHLIP